MSVTTKNIMLAAVLLLVLFEIMFMPLLGLLFIPILLIGFIFKKFRLPAKALAVSLAVLFVIFLGSFFTKSYYVGEFDNGETWVPNHSVATAVEFFFGYPSSFTAAYFGYNCNGAYGPNCSNSLYLSGAIINTVVVAGVFCSYLLASTPKTQKQK